uniref:Uncharacterized protein n=1 Tax=Arundo donax TaxID=35708 RepID=A0A0A9FZB1_ARUDO
MVLSSSVPFFGSGWFCIFAVMIPQGQYPSGVVFEIAFLI